MAQNNRQWRLGGPGANKSGPTVLDNGSQVRAMGQPRVRGVLPVLVQWAFYGGVGPAIDKAHHDPAVLRLSESQGRVIGTRCWKPGPFPPGNSKRR